MLPPPRLRVGPSGWDYAQWDGVVYPLRPLRRPHRLEYISRYFDTVEIESTFRQPVRTEISRLWLDRVAGNARFQFTAVLGRQFTHERRLEDAEVRRFKEGLWPLLRAGRLGCLVLQFPWAFRFTVENREFLIQLRRAFHEFSMAAELRHRSWLVEEALGTLIDYRLGFVNIDQPEYASAMPPTALLTTGIGYVRLHGRDKSYWVREFRAEAGDSLGNYLYSPTELGQWRERIAHVHAHATSTFVIAANPAGGKAVVNALQLSGLLKTVPEAETLHHRAVA